jgi:hypothetical protein
MGLSAEELKNVLGAEGIDSLNNSWIAGRMPPGQSCGVHPLEFFAVYNNGGLMQELCVQLGPAMPSPSLAFGLAAGVTTNNPVVPSPDLEFSPIFKPGLLS